ncbi:hypothetical protein [Ancrocorticia populi]|uniref:hypothetical protein n=1 Tax=Ancrocorticia populi TaxID=2175228 RepID=UPI003F9BC7A8
MSLMLDGTYSSDWWLIDHTGQQWTLYGSGAQGEEGVTLESISGVASTLDRELAATITQVGEDVVGESIPAISPTMVVNVHERQVPGTWAAWQHALPTRKDGWLYYSARPDKYRCLRVRGAGGGSEPEADPMRVGMVQVQVPLLGTDGCWFGEAKEYPAGTHTVTIGGELAATARVDYGRAGTLSLTVDGVQWSAGLPAPGAGKVATTLLEPAQMMKTLIEGVPDPALWSTFRNNWNPLSLTPGATVQIVVPPGATVTIQERFLTPWH